ncbi:MAG: peptide chain release factor N(5)-glutamine methyltransferase [Paracoccaceae bacterium]
MNKPATKTPPRTWQLILSSATKYLAEAGIENAQLDARWLLADALEIQRDRLTLILTEAIQPAYLAKFDSHLQRRCQHEPVSHILGTRQFFGREFKVTRDVLDPRPETEVLVQAAIEQPIDRILDLGTGSGCILLSILAEMPKAYGLGTDISEAALTVARHNRKQHNLVQNCTFAQANWLAGVAGSFDLIVANPPYISEDEMADLAPEIRDWEPKIALTPGGNGLGAYKEIAAKAYERLTVDGRLIVEIGPSQALAVVAMFQEAGLAEIEIRHDMDGRDRVVIGRRLA